MVLLYYNIITLWGHCCICGLSLTEISLCGAWLYTSRSSSVYSFLQSPVNSSLLGPNIFLNILLLQWHYSPRWASASFTIRLQASRSLALSLHSLIPIFLRSVDTSSSHLIFGLPLRLVAYSFPYNIFFGIAVYCILSIRPSHRILWLLINLTMFSPLIMASNSQHPIVKYSQFLLCYPSCCIDS